MIFNSVQYFKALRKTLDLKATLILIFYYIFYKLNIFKPKIYKIPVGPYNFYTTSIKQFAGLFMEIFIKEYYYLEKTNEPVEAIDCGANIGVSLLYIKLRAPQARVKCFEPNPAAREILNFNIKNNNWDKDVVVYSCALAKTKGEAEFFVERDEATSFGASLSKGMVGKRPLISFKVTTDKLSSYISGPIYFLKIDIEGGEFDVLEDLIATQTMSNISNLQLEYHYHPESFRKPLSEMLELLEANGFRTAVKATAEPHSLVNRDSACAYMVYAWRNA